MPTKTISNKLVHNNLSTTQIYAIVVDAKVSYVMIVLRKKFM